MPKDYLLIVGAPKCGTTSLASWLGNQPDAVLARHKETLYFTDFAERSWSGPASDFAKSIPSTAEAFDAQFAADPDASLRIEASTDNLSCPAAPDNIARFADRKDVGNIWIVALVRDPIARIMSEYEHTLRMGWQTGSLLQSLRAEEERMSKGWHPLFWHVERSRYAEQLARYRTLFGQQVRVMDFHRLEEPEQRSGLLRWIGRHDGSNESPMAHSNQRSVVARPGTLSLLKNKSLLSVGRVLVPKSIRPVVRRLITGGFVERYRPSAQEIDFIRSALADDICACGEASDIPTACWDPILRNDQ